MNMDVDRSLSTKIANFIGIPQIEEGCCSQCNKKLKRDLIFYYIYFNCTIKIIDPISKNSEEYRGYGQFKAECDCESNLKYNYLNYRNNILHDNYLLYFIEFSESLKDSKIVPENHRSFWYRTCFDDNDANRLMPLFRFGPKLLEIV